MTIGKMLERGLAQAGLTELGARALRGQGLSAADLDVLARADLLLVCGLADAVRRVHRGDEVRLLNSAAAGRAPDLVRLNLDAGRGDGPTGEELLRDIALARLAAPCAQGIAVSFDQLGLELAQTALAFGADALWGELDGKRTLPLLGNQQARRSEIEGLIERSGRRPIWVEAQSAAVESRS
jgi:2-iminoacetate synthase ThiH